MRKIKYMENNKQKPQKRIRSWFALFPVKIETVKKKKILIETRWLEDVTVEQELRSYFKGFDEGSDDIWVNVKFIDSNKKKLKNKI